VEEAMFNPNVKAIKKNSGTLAMIFVLVIFSLLLSLLINSIYLPSLDEKPLDENGSINIGHLIISEVMSANDGAFADVNGDLFDWIELYNGRDVDISLLNYGLSDVEDKVKWLFPDVIIPAKSYLVIYLSGQKMDGLYAGFSLKSSGGETLILKEPSGKVIDALNVVAFDKNKTMARNNRGEWFVSDQITPGFPNTKEGHEQYMQSIRSDDTQLKITEFLPDNRGNFVDKFGELTGFIEITNVSEETVNLRNVFVSNSLSTPFRYRLPDKILRPGESIAVFTSGKGIVNDQIHADFRLRSKNGVVVLSHENKVLDVVEYQDVINGYARILVDDKWIDSISISPGHSNNNEGIDEFARIHQPNKSGLLINEVMSRNTKYLPHNGSNTYDWIEFFNNSNQTINLSSYTITTNLNDPQRYRLPAVQLQAGQYFVLIASGEPNLSTQTYTHANFKVSDIESLYLLKDNVMVDSVFIADIPVDASYGRMPEGGFAYMTKPTPGAKNLGGVRQVSNSPKPLLSSGVYNQVDSLLFELTTFGPTFYTTDGSEPSARSKRYQGPTQLDKTSVIRFVTIEEGKLPSQVMTSSYIINENHSLPVLSMTLDPSNFRNLITDVWTVGIEYPGHAELYENGSSFSIDAGIRLFGGSARGLAKKSFALKFKRQYGESKLNYSVFDSRDYSQFDTLVLRSGSQDYPNAFFRDVLATSLVDGVTSLSVQAYKPVILYINGSYYGIFNIREKVDEDYISSLYNVDTRANIVRIDSDVTSGSGSGYQSLLSYVTRNDVALDEHYNYIKTRLNVVSYADFWAAQMIVTNNDIINTRFFSHPDIDNGRWQMIFYDFDFAMYNFNRDFYAFATNPDGMSRLNVSTLLFRNIIRNQEFRTLFVERLSYQLKYVWNEKRVSEAIDELVQLYGPEMVRERQRWGLSYDAWDVSVERLRRYFQLRNSYLLPQTQKFFNLSDAEMERYFGGL
jgi:hypothetical protein